MKILVTGVTGMLGHKMFQIIRSRFPGTIGTAIEDVTRAPFDKVDFLQGRDVIGSLDLTDFGRLAEVLNNLRPDYIINCAGIVKQNAQGDSAIPLITVNALLPHKLAAIVQNWRGKVIQTSTDCVFSGRTGGYTEDDIPDPEDLYGKSKALGEIYYENALTLRTSIIGRELAGFKSLLEWLISQRNGNIKGFSKVIYSGVTTLELAGVVTRVIQEYPYLHGLYQVVSKPISKYELLMMLNEAYGLKIRIVGDSSITSDRSIKGERFLQATGYTCPKWPELVRAIVEDPTPYDQWRNSL